MLEVHSLIASFLNMRASAYARISQSVYFVNKYIVTKCNDAKVYGLRVLGTKMYGLCVLGTKMYGLCVLNIEHWTLRILYGRAPLCPIGGLARPP